MLKKLITISAVLAVCSTTAVPAAQAASSTVSQYAATAVATSEYGAGLEANSANQAIGAPTAEVCGDSAGAWASETQNTIDTMTVTFATAVLPSQIKIWSNASTSTLAQVEVKSADTWTTVFTRNLSDEITTGAICDTTIAPHVINTAAVIASGHTWPTGTVNEVRITVDQSILEGWTGEIDAVELTGNALAATAKVTGASLKGIAKINKKVAVNLGVYTGTPTPTSTIKWYACKKNVASAKTAVVAGCSVIAGATKNIITLKKAQLGKYVSVLVTSTNGQGSPVLSFSKSTKKVTR